MIEWLLLLLGGLVTWLWSSAVTLHYLAGFFIVAGGFVMFVGSVIHHYWKRSRDRRMSAAPLPPLVDVHIENLNVTLQLTEAQVQELIAQAPRKALPPAKEQRVEDDLP
jgi:hypothetical protein